MDLEAIQDESTLTKLCIAGKLPAHHVAVDIDRDSATAGKLHVDGTVILTLNPTLESGVCQITGL